MSEWLVFVLGSVPGAILAILAGTGLVSESLALALFAPSFVGLNLAHMAAAWGHAWLDPPGWRSAPVERAVVPAALVVASLATEAAGAGVLLLVAQYWLSLHHATMQNFGIVRALKRRREGRLLDLCACTLLPLGALAYRALAVCNQYEGLSMPRPPGWLWVILVVPGSVALVAFVVREMGQRDRLPVAMVVTTNLLWSLLLVGLSHPLLPLYAFASGHYVQQLYFVWRRPERSWLASPVGYLAGLTAAGGVVVFGLTLATVAVRTAAGAHSPIPPWVAAMIGVNLSHYWLESRIWRAPRLAPSPSSAA